MKPKFRGPAVFIAFAGIASVLLAFALIKKPSFNLLKPSEPPVIISTMTVRANDNLALILKRDVGLPMPYIIGIQKALAPAFKERSLREKDHFQVVTSTDGIFKKLVYSPSRIVSHVVTLSTQNVYSYKEVVKPTVWVEKWVAVDVTESLYRDMLKAGFTDAFVGTLIGGEISDNIFAWKIDFFTEQRPGDRLEALYEQENIVEGEKLTPINNVRVLAASYTGKATRKKQNLAFRYQAPDAKKADYYDEDGNAVKKAFLRVPFTHRGFRLSSRFSTKRFHPILRTYRPHHGIDYAAPHGTSVSSIGKGKVIYAGWKSGFGNTVEVRHDSKHVSRYGHLSSMSVKVGDSIEQGKVVGRVGSTGLSTGPHLHFEMLVNGSQRNFLAMDFPSAAAVDGKNMADFKRVRDNLQARLNSNEKAVETAKKN